MAIDNQRAVSELLRSADKAIKDGNLDNALAAISRVFEFDQRNVYARAYQERILSLKEMQLAAKANAEKIPADSEKKVQESNFAPAKPAPPPREEPPSAAQNDAPPAEPLPQHPVFVPLPENAEDETSAAAEAPAADDVSATAEAPADDAPAPAAPVTADDLPAAAAASGTPDQSAAASSRVFDYVKGTPARLEAYKALLAEIWTAGTFTDTEEQRVRAVRHSFAITDEEHTRIERDIRFAAYMTAIESAWKRGVTSFDEMRRQYRITDQEHLQIEGRVFRLLQSLRSVGTVLLIDDDNEFLQLASRQLTEAGFYCVSVPTCEEALFVLDSLTPNVVVCDVNFGKPNMSGFAFYEKFRAIERFFPLPFIFLSGMVQEAVQRTGMQMGADYYFTKPIDLELFLATIEGKIKRSYELQQRLTPHLL